ncbi:hypothetical protein SAMN06265379_101427 [Saccharicrinis carchari]|uniref:Uncharacterized protein n=2 Tax=Saccharicrinis carchari TaxID=1168039 RepID=A0A521AVS7_SACCC|nr:hypothetical protein SAMN06265379_101427 [Saccharicrinis carchari]
MTEELIFSLIDHVCEMVEGVEKIIGVYNHPKTGELCGITLKHINNRLQEHQMNLRGQKEILAGLRQCKHKYSWPEKTQLPFSTIDSTPLQRNIFDESDHLTLLITLPGSKRTEKDLLLIYFKDHFNTFGVQHQNTTLSTDNKTIIAHLLSGSIHSFCKLYWKEKERLQQFTHKTQRILDQQRSENQKDIRKKELEDFICSWANMLLKERSESDGVNYVYSDQALEKIKTYSGGLEQLQKALHEAVDYTNTLITDANKVIEAEYIEGVTYVNSGDVIGNLDAASQHLTTRQQRVYDFLNRLESAAIQVDRSGINLTGSHIGSAMEKPVSAPALSDYIGKNKEVINTLFAKYPDKWSFVKNNFKSIINITLTGERPTRKWA